MQILFYISINSELTSKLGILKRKDSAFSFKLVYSSREFKESNKRNTMNAVIIVSKAINYEVVNKVIFSCLEQNVCPLLFVILTALEFLILNPFDFRQAFYFSRQRKVEWTSLLY